MNHLFGFMVVVACVWINWMNRCMCGCMEGELIDKSGMVGWIDGWMSGWVDGQTDGCMDG